MKHDSEELIKYMGYSINPDAGVVFGILGNPLKSLSSNGYVQARRANPRLSMSAHRIVWQSVNGDIPKGLHINHINGIKTDNRIANLELVTPKENTRHAIRTGLMKPQGENRTNAKLTDQAVRSIRTSKDTQRSLARRYGVSQQIICAVINKKAWGHIA